VYISASGLVTCDLVNYEEKLAVTYCLREKRDNNGCGINNSDTAVSS